MKKQLIALWMVILILPSCVSVAHANEGYALADRNFMPESIIASILDMKDSVILDHDPTSGKVEYVSWISYDKLSELSTGWRTGGVIVFNATMNAYFLRISYMPTVSIDGQLKYCALGTSNGYCYGSRATEKGDTNIDNSVTINKTTVVWNRVITSVVGTADKKATDVTTGLKNILDWLSLQVKATMIVADQVDLTNDLLYWIADNFQDMLYAIGKADLLIAQIGIDQWKELLRLEDFLSAINYNQIYAYYAQNGFFFDILDTVEKLGARLDSVISNGAVQINTSSIDARLDKLISMYSKVNSVVLDTAAVNGGQIKSAVGGELKDVVFWGSARRQNPHLLTMPLNYTLSDAPVTLGAPELRSIPLGASIPAYISADPVLAAGVWKSGSTYYLSDTYNAVTGEYVQRIKSIVFDGSENWVRSIRANDASLFSVSCIPDNTLSMPMWSSRYGFKTYTSAFDLADDSTKTVTSGYFSHYGKYIRFQDSSTSLDGWKKWLSIKYKAGEPLEVWYALAGESVTTYLDLRPTIAIPEGDSTISADMLRITAKYETYDSYTQTADIIAAINNIPPYDDSGLIAAITNMSRPTVTTDLTEITTRLDDILGELRSTSGSATCEHSYAQDMEQDATCTLPGLMISTCAKCGDSYSEIVDPLGHDWVVSSHVDAVTDPETGEETASAYDVYTCSRCGQTYEDHSGDGAPDEDYSNTSISKLVVQVFSKLGTFAGKLIGFFVHLLDKALTSVDNVISKFNDYTAQIGGFGGAYPSWLTGFWAIIPMELQTALTFAVICMALGAVGRKLFFS